MTRAPKSILGPFGEAAGTRETDGRALPVKAGLERIRERLARTGGLFVCLDFDGTLAPIAADPAVPEMTPANRRALESLVDRPGISVAIVSGRALADVRTRVDVDGLNYAGNHGLELDADGERAVHPAAAERLPTLHRIRDELAARLAPLPGCELEDKRLSLTVHFRRTDPADAARAYTRTTNAVRTLGDGNFRLQTGKSVVEVLPAIPVGKDNAVRQLRTEAARDALAVYVGDDTSDEAAFEEIAPEGVGVHVGDETTAADYRVDGPGGVARLLRWLNRETRRL